MRVPTKSMFTALGLLLAAVVTDARGQVNIPFGPANCYDQNLQIFAPLELDLDNLPVQDDCCGYYFGWDKLALSYSGERAMVGDPNIVQFAEVVYRLNDDPTITPFLDENNLDLYYDPFQVKNSLLNVPPNGGFALGDRYEFGYRDHDNGWMIGIIKGPRLYETEVYGFGQFNPTIDLDYTDATDVQNDPGPPTGEPSGPIGAVRAFGFGSVPVLFDAPANYLRGFVDYLNYLDEAESGTVAGPIMYVGNYSNPIFQEPNAVDTGSIFRRADDLDHDTIPGSVIIVDPDTDAIIGIVNDYDDLHDFDVFFDQVTVTSFVKTDGVEAMWTHELSNTHYQAKNQNNRLELSYGARFFRFYDDFNVTALGSILGPSAWDTSIDNQIVGPQVALRWANQRQRWTINTDVRFTFGYNVQDWHQVANMGAHLIPGALNRPLYARPTCTINTDRTQEFSPLGELRVEAAYHLTKAFALKVGYTGMYVGNVRRAAPAVRYYLPSMGFQDAGTQNLVVNGVNFGVEFVR